MVIFICPTAKPVLRPCFFQRQHGRCWLNSQNVTSLNGVFALNNKQPSAGIFNTFWHRIRAEVEISDARLHDLRHNYASIALRSGENLRVIGMLLGHVDAETTLRYAHLDDATMHSAVNKVAKSMTKRTRRTK